ncbi:hybrid sensor histidine kinase/response regulator transcription factor [Hymenobacter nivis]|nr:two-component regulator propeller domain-containing protein [Hymenobacter nivis]
MLVLAGLGAHAQDTPPGELRFEHITVDQGLSHSDAMCMAQDHDGFIWVGTNRGINRYDGYQLKSYALPINPGDGQSGNRIKALLVAPSGQLWVGAERAGLSRYDAAHDTFVPLATAALPPAYRALARRLSLSDVTTLATDAQGSLWVGTAQDGLFVLTLDGQGQPLALRQLPPTAAGRPSLAGITSLVLDAERNAWVGTLGAGLVVVRTAEPGLPAEATSLALPVSALCLDRRGDLWAGTEQQLFWVPAADRRAGHALAAHALPRRYPRIQALHLDSFGRLWAGTLYGLYVWEAGPATGTAPPLQTTRPTLLLPRDGEPHRINSERVHQIFEDQHQLVWLCASAGGLNKVDLRQRAFGQLRHQLTGRPTLSNANNYVNAVYKEEAANTLWFGSRNGVSAYDLAGHTYRNYLNQQSDTVRGVDVATIFRAADGTLWFGTRDNGLVALRRTGGHERLTTYRRLPDGFDLSTTSIEHLAQDGRGTLWVATFSGGLLRFSPDGRLLGRYCQARSGLPTSQFTYLLYDAQRDVLWASTRNAGLLKLRPTADSLRLLAQYQYAPGLPNSLRVNYVWPLLLGKNGALWIGTIGGGLHQLTTDAQGRDAVCSFASSLPETDVESLLPDDAGNLWIGGTGLYRFTPATRQYLRYDVADGLQSNAFKIGAAARGADGTLYFGGINGINYFQPAAIQANPYPPVVQFTGLRVMNQSVAVGQSLNGRVLLPRPLTWPQTLTIKPSENDFSVEFVALNYTNPQKTHYAYRLLGYRPGWVRPGPGQRTASFANLPPGRYTLEVKADNGEGVWAKTPATVQFEVLAPWYKTGWAYLLYAAALLGAIALYRRAEMAQQNLRNKLALEHFQVEKEKELTNLKLGFFTNVSHELRTPLTLILGPMEELIGAHDPVSGLRDKLLLMHKQTRKLFDLVNQLLDFRKVESGNVPLRASYGPVLRLVAEVFAAFEQKAAERRLTYLLDLPAEDVGLYFDRSKLEIILTNLLANAFKYTPEGGRIEVAATVVGTPGGKAVFAGGLPLGNYLEISVVDTGTGIAAAELAHIFDPYYQASHTDTLRMTGTGIGLSLVKQFAERHGGGIQVESQVGAGSTFRLLLPFGQAHLHPADVLPPDTELATPAEPLPGAALDSEDADALPLANEPVTLASLPRLLVVEDSDEVRQYLQQLFAPSFEVLAAADGLEGWEMALSQLPSLIVSDVMMPRSDGLELCRRLKQHPKTSHIPVLLLTARTAALHEVEGLGLGADDYVSKPFNPQLLQAKVAALLRNRRQLREYYQRQLLLEPTEAVIPDADRTFLEQAMRTVEQHLTDPTFSVLVLAGELCMSQSVLYRRLKSITGQTVVEFIRDVRMKRAAQLLAQPQLRVSEAAFQVGVENVKYFSKTFQKIYGVAPSEYARQHRPPHDEVVESTWPRVE